MFFAVRGTEANIKCDECGDYFLVNGFWPPTPTIAAICECGAQAYWHFDTAKPIPTPTLAWISSEEA